MDFGVAFFHSVLEALARLCAREQALFVAKKLTDNETRHFKKAWLFEVATYCYDEVIDAQSRQFVTRPARTRGVFKKEEEKEDGTRETDRERSFERKRERERERPACSWKLSLETRE